MKTKKELKEEYKQKKFKMGVFQVRNLVNSKIFIGSSPDLEAIWNRQKTQLKFGSHPNKKLQADWQQFGAENFTFEILAEIKQDKEGATDYSVEIKELEELYLEELQPYGEKGYNKKQK